MSVDVYALLSWLLYMNQRSSPDFRSIERPISINTAPVKVVPHSISEAIQEANVVTYISIITIYAVIMLMVMMNPVQKMNLPIMVVSFVV